MPVLDAVSSVFYNLISPIQWLVAWVMVRFHDLWTLVGLDPAGGAAWALSIVGLVVVVRLALVPLFVRQVTATRRMQSIQPELRAIQARYKGRTDPASRQALQQEQLALMRSSGTNPMAGCLPILLQAPVLFALFTTLNGLRQHASVGPLTDTLVRQADAAALLSAPLSGSLWGSEHPSTIVAATALILLMSASQFLTQKLVLTRNTAVAPTENALVLHQQKLLLYGLPLLIVVPSLHFPIGVLLYWLVSNLWSLGQQIVVIRLLPNPGSPAEEQLARRKARRAARGAGTTTELTAPDLSAATPAAQVPVPRRQPRTHRRRNRRRAGEGPGSGDLR